MPILFRRVSTGLHLLFLVIALAFYPALSSAQGALLWFNQARPTSQAIQAIQILAAAHTEGLTPSDYNAEFLREAVNHAAHGPTPSSAAIAVLDSVLSASMERYLTDLHKGKLDPHLVHRYFKAPAPDDFDAASYLSQAIALNRLPQAVAQAAPRIPLYSDLRHALAAYRDLKDHSAWKSTLTAIPGQKLEPGQAYKGIPVLAQRLVALGDLPAGIPIPARYEGVLVQGVRSFQLRHGLPINGFLDHAVFKQLQVTPARRVEQIELTLERLRWTPLGQTPRVIVVNIPEFMLRAYAITKDNATVMAEMKIIVGRALDTRTPVFSKDMRFIEFSPYWNIPASIVRSETIPHLRRDPGYFDQQGLEFVTKDGQAIGTLSEANLQALQRGELRLRQRPGPRNALGDIKFIFPNDRNIYLHHTPAPQLFGHQRRDFSHGCIRVEQPVALAKFVLYDESDWTEDHIRAAMAGGVSKTIRLKQPLPVVITYSTVTVKNDKVYFFRDLYGQDAALAKALKQRVRAAAP